MSFKKHNKNNYRKNNYRKNNYHKNNYEKYTVKFNNMPSDITDYELRGLLRLWNPIGRINVNHYRTNTVVYVDFKNKTQAIKAHYQLNKTAFDGLIISLEKLFDE